MLDKIVNEVKGVFGLNPPTRRRLTRTAKKRSYSAPARRTKRKAKRTTRRRR